MSTIIRIGLVAVALIAILVIVVPAIGEPYADIVVDRADTIRQVTVASNSGLNSSFGSKAARVVVAFANTVRHFSLVTPPTDLQSRVTQVATRIVTQYAISIRHDALTAPPGAMKTALGQVASRIVFQFANGSRELPLSYPKQLISDKTAPKITQTALGGNKFTWTTDEFTICLVRYGTQPGVYLETVSEVLYAKQHEITINLPGPGATIYVQVSSTDLSGNTTVSQEYRFTGEQKLYLPLIKR